MTNAIESLRPYRNAAYDNRRWADFVPRAGDIVVCTPPKCGTTWTQAIVASLLWPDGKPPGQVMEIGPWIEFELFPIDRVLASLEAQKHRRFMKSHTPADGIPFFEDTRYVAVARDGRDAFMSLCNHLERFKDEIRDGLNTRALADGVPPMPGWDGDIHGFFWSWLAEGLHFQHVASFWERRHDPRVLLVHFNDLRTDLAGEMRRIAEFLAIDVPEADWEAVVERCTFASMRARSEEIGPFDQVFEGGAQSFLYKGTNGRWREVLRPEELSAYTQRVAEFLSPEAALWHEQGRNPTRGRST